MDYVLMMMDGSGDNDDTGIDGGRGGTCRAMTFHFLLFRFLGSVGAGSHFISLLFISGPGCSWPPFFYCTCMHTPG